MLYDSSFTESTARVLKAYPTGNTPASLAVYDSNRHYGIALLAGMDLFLISHIHITPKAEITTGAALPESGNAGSKRFTNYGLGIGIGLTF